MNRSQSKCPNEVLIDPEDHHLFEGHHWRVDIHGYVVRWEGSSRARKKFYLHREVMKKHGLLSDGQVVDHIDGDPLNNRKENLRATNQSVNLHNAAPKVRVCSNMPPCIHATKYNTYYGVTTIKYKVYYTGTFPTVEQAVAKVVELKKLHGVWTEPT